MVGLKIPTKWRATLLGINWFGVAAGILMVLLAGLAFPWWGLNAGGEAITAAISPFNVEISALGVPMHIPLIWYVCLGARLFVSIAGMLLILSSLIARRWWSKRLIRFGATKMLWMVIMLIVSLALLTLMVNYFLSRTLPGLSLPYVSGSATVVIPIGDATATLPFTMVLMGAFWVAVLSAVLGVAARIYHRRFMEKPSRISREAEGKRV